MPKSMTRLYPLDVERLPWQPLPGARGDAGDAPAMRLLGGDPADSYTGLVRAPAGGAIAPAGAGRWEELYVLGGALALDGRRYGPGSYLCIPPGMRTAALEPLAGAPLEALVLHDAHDARMDKPHVRLTGEEAEAIAPETALAGAAGDQRTLARGPSGSTTRLLDVPPHGDTGVVVHDFSEEGLILRGSYKMAWRLGDELHPAGTYTYLPPHTEHGPMLTNEGYRCFEVRNTI